MAVKSSVARLDVLPILPLHHIADALGAHAKPARKRTHRNPATRMLGAQCQHLGSSEFRPIVRFSRRFPRRVHTPFPGHVRHVFLMRAEEEMIGSYAPPIGDVSARVECVAGVTHLLTFRDSAMRLLPRNPMRLFGDAMAMAHREHAVAMRTPYGASPQPTSVRAGNLIDVAPEAIHRRFNTSRPGRTDLPLTLQVTGVPQALVMRVAQPSGFVGTPAPRNGTNPRHNRALSSSLSVEQCTTTHE